MTSVPKKKKKELRVLLIGLVTVVVEFKNKISLC